MHAIGMDNTVSERSKTTKGYALYGSIYIKYPQQANSQGEELDLRHQEQWVEAVGEEGWMDWGEVELLHNGYKTCLQ